MMSIMGKRFTNRGVSVIIAALLLIAIAVAAAVLLYVFSIGLLGSLQGSGGQQTKEQVILEAYNWATPGTLVLNLRNVGSASVNLLPNAALGGPDADYYVAGLFTVSSTSSCTATMAPQTSCSTSLTVTGTSGVAAVIKVVTPSGGVFSYSAIPGQSS